MKILLLAGEESGLIYANRLKAMMPKDEVRGYADYGFNTADLAVMGFTAVIAKLGYFLRVKKTMMRAIDEWKPDVVCTVDYPGMNLRLASYAKSKGIRSVHIVCPQVWAWKAGRIPKIEASLDKLYCFFPFEPGLFRDGFAEFVGHPLVEEFKRTKLEASRVEASPGNQVAFLPGSRIGEIERNLPIMLKSAKMLGSVRIAVPAANDRAYNCIAKILAANAHGLNVVLSKADAREVLLSSICAVVASGTATLEAALARCPTVLVYKVGPIFAWLARRVIKGIRHIGLVNIVWEKSGGSGVSPMPELLQEDFTPENVASILKRWITSSELRMSAIKRLDDVVAMLGGGVSAFDRMVSSIKEEK